MKQKKNEQEAKLFSEQSDENLLSGQIKSSRSIFPKSSQFQADYYLFPTHDKKQLNEEKKNDFVRKFIKNMLDQVQKVKKVKGFHLSLIGDQGSSDEFFFKRKAFTFSHLNKKQLKCLQNLQEYLIHKLNKIPLIHPGQYIKMIWDIVAVAARLYFLYIIPIDLAWVNQQFIFHDFKYISILFLLILIIDMLISLNTVYFLNGEAVTSRSKIVKQSLYNTYGLQWLSVFQLLIYFIIDRYVDISLDINNNLINIGLLIFLVHHKTIINYATNYEEGLNISKKTSSVFALFKLIAFLFYVIHLFSCFWFWIGKYSIENYEGKSWLITTNTLEQQWNTQYLQSFYYTAVTIFTVGYGDVTPQSNIEKIVTVILIMISSIQLPFSVNTVGNIITEMTAFSEERRRKLRIINSYMNKSSMSTGLQMQIRQYLTYYWENQVVSQSDEEKEIIDSLSEFLRQQLISEAHQKIFDQCTLFKIQLKNQIYLYLLVNYLNVNQQKRQRKCFQHQSKIQSLLMIYYYMVKQIYIFKFNLNQLYYIEDGSIQICLQQDRKINLGIVNKGASIGIKNFIMGSESQETYKSVGFTKAMILKRKSFLKILQDHPDDQELFFSIRDKMIFYQDDQYFTVSCFSCGKESHKLIECPLIKFVPNRELIIKKHLYPQQQLRKLFDRTKKKNTTLIQDKKRLEQSALLIQKEEPKLFQLYKFDHMFNIDEEQQQKRNIKQITSFQHINDQVPQTERERYLSILVNNKKSIKKKFQQLVNKLIKQQYRVSQIKNKINFQTVSINKVYPYFLIQTYVLYEKQMEQRQISMTLQILEQRCKNICQFNNKQFDKYLSDMSLIIQKLSIKQYIDDQDFESPKAYKFYFRKDNFSVVKQKNFLYNLNTLKKFIQYVQYPGDLIKQFNLTQVGFYQLINRRRPKICVSADYILK